MPLTEAKQAFANMGEVMSQPAREHNHELPPSPTPEPGSP